MSGAIVGLLCAMLLVVVLYYCWPPWTAILTRYATWQHSLGLLGAALASGIAGGILSELSIVYVQHRGRWTLASLNNMTFKFTLFVITGGMVSEFYQFQAWFWGDSSTWRIITCKVAVDQFIYSIFWATPFATMCTRWHANHYSFTGLRQEFDGTFIVSRMLPIGIANFVFWLPAVFILYSVPLILQTPMFLFGTAIWGLLLPAVSHEGHPEEVEQAAMVAGPVVLPDVE